jgi:hypothetical protein
MAFLAPSLQRLFAEVNERWPTRDTWSDGWLGDTSHSARFSDHNPDGSGMVHAVDIDATLTKMTMGSGTVGDFVLAELLKRCRDGRLDQVINYLIYKERIYSRSSGYASRVYTGINAHDSHVHVSIHYTTTAERYDGPWGIRDDREWDEVATKAEIREVVSEEIRRALTADNAALLNAIRVGIEAERAEDALAAVDALTAALSSTTPYQAKFRSNVRVPVDAELTQRGLGV